MSSLLDEDFCPVRVDIISKDLVLWRHDGLHPKPIIHHPAAGLEQPQLTVVRLSPLTRQKLFLAACMPPDPMNVSVFRAKVKNR